MEIADQGVTTPTERARCILLAHPHTLIREGISRILRDAGFRVLEQADTWPGIQRQVLQQKPDIILLDCEISDSHMDEVSGLIRDFPSLIAVIITRPESHRVFLKAMMAGVKGYLSINLSAQEFVQALNMLARGDFIVSQDIASCVQKELASGYQPKSRDGLSEREREVLGLLGTGATNREIAQRLIVSEHTVKVHLRTILGKLNLRNRQQATAYAIKQGLVTDLDFMDGAEPASRLSPVR